MSSQPQDGPPPLARSCSGDETLILLDWDDTVLPTSWLLSQLRAADGSPPPTDELGAAVVVPDPGRLPPAARKQLADLEAQLLHLLEALSRTGVPVVVTNAGDRYVELTGAAFLPSVAAWLSRHRVDVVSARAWYEADHPGDVPAWKARAFRDVVDAWAESHGGAPPRQVISVGDGTFERSAAHGLVSRWASIASVKTVKLADEPACRDLAREARFLAKQLPGLAALEGDVDTSVTLGGAGKGATLA